MLMIIKKEIFTLSLVAALALISSDVEARAAIKQFNNKQQQDTANFEIAGNALKITLNTPIAKENLLVEDNDTNYTGTISLQLTRLETILATINSDKFTIAFDDAFDGCVALLGDDYKWIMSGMGD